MGGSECNSLKEESIHWSMGLTEDDFVAPPRVGRRTGELKRQPLRSSLVSSDKATDSAATGTDARVDSM